MSEDLNSYLLFDLSERELEVLTETKGPIAKVMANKHLKKVRHFFKNQELPMFGKPGSRHEVAITGIALAAWLAYLGYKHYKKSIQDGKEPHIALRNRIMFLHSSRSQCNVSLNPPECKRRVDSQIRKLTNEEKLRKEKV